MSRLLPLLTLIACGPPWIGYTRADAEKEVHDFITAPEHDGDAWAVFVPSRFGVGGRSRRGVGSDGPWWLRDAAVELERCGVQRGDLLDVRLFVDPAAWPWDVDVREATPGTGRCVAAVLQRLPVDADLEPGESMALGARVTLDELLTPTPEELDPRECEMSVSAQPPRELFPWYLRWVPISVPGRLEQSMDVEHVGELAAEVSCPSTMERTRLTVIYRAGALHEVHTAPHVPCVEEAAREVLADFSALAPEEVRSDPRQALDNMEGWIHPAQGAWDDAVCGFDVPLRPE